MKNKLTRIILLCVSLALVIFFVFDFFADLRIVKDLESDSRDIPTDEKNYQTITLAELAQQRDEFVVYDVREKEEFEQGHIKGAEHLRLGDLLASKKKQKQAEISKDDKRTIFFCHDGKRSKMAAGLFSDELDQIFVVEDAFDQLRGNGDLKEQLWEGITSQVLPGDFWKDLKNRGYRAKKIETDLVVDVSTKAKNLSGVAPGAKVIHLPMMTISSEKVEKGIEKIGTNTFTVVCDDKASCFYAKLLAYRVENQGGKFVGYFYWGRDN